AYTVNLTIDDSRGGTAAASVSVTVMPVIPNSAALSLGKSSGQQGAQNIIIPLNLTSLPANIVTGLNLDITYDNTALTFSQVTAGKASSDAQKSVSSSAPQPGTIRIIVFGLNQNTMANGEAAQVSFNITADAKAGETTLSLSNATATDAQAKPITLTLVNGVITITEKPNNPPVLSAIGNKSVNEGETLTLTISATDPDNDNLTYSATGLPTGATFTASTKTFSWTPGYNQAGTYPAVHFSVADTKGGTDSEDITITVTDVNRSPQISSGPLSTPATINENQTAQISVTAVDPDGDNLTYQWQAAGGTITGSGATVTYNPPDVSAQTAYTVNLTIDDSRGGTAAASVSVTVMPAAAGTAHLTLGSAQGYPGDNIPIPLNISSTPSGKVVSGLKVDLFYDAAALNVASVTIGQAATDAQKSLTYIQIAAGRLRIIVFGLNQDTIADGEVANINFKILSSSSLGEKTLRLDSCFVTDPDALNAPLTTDAGAIKVLDHTPPTGTILINNGAEYTNNPAITLTLSASDESSVAEMRFSNDGITYSQPEAYASTKSWNLIPGEGTKTIYVIFKDSVNNWNQSPFTDTVILDTTPPVMRITNPTQMSLLTNNPVLNISGEVEEDTAGIAAVRINGNNLPLLRKGKMSIFSYAARLTEGLNTLTVECIDGAGNQAQTEILATLDSQAPSGAISINNGARYTNSPEVILSLQAEELTSSSGIERMQFSNDGTKFSDLEDYSSTKNWSLSSREGEKTAYVRFQDKAGNLSSAFKAGIILDQTVPRGSFSINNGAEYTNSQTVALTFSASDDLSGVSQMRIRAGDKDSGEIPYSQAYGLTLSPGDGTKTISVQFKDGAGNWSGDEAISSSIILDTAAPAQPVLSRITPTLDNGYTKTREINIHADKEQDTAIFINSREKAALNKSSSFNSRVTLEEGQNSIRITAKDAAGNESAPLDLEVKLKTKVG
ncbi:MAG: cohesin domain-containing protein, partial [Candidatus Omnitrophota bacterium]